MRILALEVHNVQKIAHVNFDLDGRHLFLVGGKNGNGKSSALIGLLMALAGRSGMDNYPEMALKAGEDEGWINVSLSGDDAIHQPGGIKVQLKLIRHPRKGTVVEELRVMDTDDDPAPAPRELLNRLKMSNAFDPLEFQRMKPKDRKVLLEKLLGLDFTEDNKTYDKLYEQRTEVNREFNRAKAQLDGMVYHPDVVEVSASDLMTEMERRRSVNSANNEKRLALTNLAKSLASSDELILKVDSDIAELEKKIEFLKTTRAKMVESKTELAAKVAEQKPLVEDLVDEKIDEIRQQIGSVDENNRKARENAKRKEVSDRFQELGRKSEALTERLKAIKDGNEKKLKEAKFPVPGMSLDADGILLNGLPFEQASTAERIAASVKVGIAMNPTLRLMVSQDGGALDDEAIAALDKTLQEHDFQMIVEVATRTAADEDLCAVVIKDGKVAKANPKPTLFAEPDEAA